MSLSEYDTTWNQMAEQLAQGNHSNPGNASPAEWPSHPLWRRLRELGTELWLDSGDMEEINDVWTREFTGLTTNNTLLNREIQKGLYDEIIEKAVQYLQDYPLMTDHERVLEVTFILNVHHALRLVERFDAHVSVEEHTDLTNDLEGTMKYARRFHELSEGRLYVKIPYSSGGILATKRAAGEGIPINYTLGFSARQNYLVGRVAQPAFVNVFLGRLDSFIADNHLGENIKLGEKATLASQALIRQLREQRGVKTRQIAASLRDKQQILDLAGVDVMTIPPRVAREFVDSGIPPEEIQDQTRNALDINMSEEKIQELGINAVWDLEDRIVDCCDALEAERLEMFTPVRLRGFFQRHGCGDVLVKWTEQEVETSAAEGKIPAWEHWKDSVQQGRIGLDSLMSLAGWNQFHKDQQDMDRRIMERIEAART